MLFIDKDEDVIGKTISEDFLISNKYRLQEDSETHFDSDHFIHYEKNGNEIVIFRKDVDVYIAGEQMTPGAPWQIRLTEELLNRFVDQAPEGYVTMQEATRILGVTRQTVLQRVKNGELDAVHVYRGRRKGLRINVINNQSDLFNHSS